LPPISKIRTIKENLLKPKKLSEDLSEDEREEILGKKEELNFLLAKTPRITKKKPENLQKTFKNNSEPNLFLNEKIVPIEKNPKKKKEIKIITEINNNLIINENPAENPINDTKKTETKKIENSNNNDSNTNNFNNLQLPSSKSVLLTDRDIIANYNKNKIDVLFEISEEKHENTVTDSDEGSNIDNVKNKKGKKKEMIERNLKERKLSMKYLPSRSIIGYKSKLNDKKKTMKLKKLGNNFSDFII